MKAYEFNPDGYRVVKPETEDRQGMKLQATAYGDELCLTADTEAGDWNHESAEIWLSRTEALALAAYINKHYGGV